MTDLLDFTKALADETRHEIITRLCCQWLSVGEVVAALDGRIGQPTVSHHLKQLEVAGLVMARKDGRRRLYTLDQRRVSVCCGQLMERFAPEYAPGGQPGSRPVEVSNE